MGQALYEKFGYKVQETVYLKDDVRFNARMEGPIHCFMQRPRKLELLGDNADSIS